jgi:hypothetical protein
VVVEFKNSNPVFQHDSDFREWNIGGSACADFVLRKR